MDAAPTPTPRNPILTALLVLALLYTAWAASPVLVPVVLAMALALVANPLVRLMQALWIPRWLGGMGVLMGGLAGTVLLASVLLEPAAEWVRQAPSEVRQHAPKLRELARPFEEARSAASASVSELTGSTSSAPPAQSAAPQAPAAGGLWSFLSGTPIMLASVGGILLLAYFFLLYGESLQRQVIQVMPTRVQQRVTVDILRTIEREVSRYVITISLINAGLGLATAAALWAIGLAPQDALLWGVVVGLLNFAPYVGPMLGVLALTLVGMVAFKDLGHALAVPAAFLALTALEGQLLTPMILGRSLAISPLVLLLWLLLWGWLWGIAGVLLAVPMLVCFKIVAARVDGWQGWARVIER